MIRHRPRCWMLQGLVVVGTHLQQCVLSPAAFGVGHRVRPQLFPSSTANAAAALLGSAQLAPPADYNLHTYELWYTDTHTQAAAMWCKPGIYDAGRGWPPAGTSDNSEERPGALLHANTKTPRITASPNTHL
jgi:hypothetical protein